MGTGGPAPVVNGTATASAPVSGAQDAVTQRGQASSAEEPLPAGQVSYRAVAVPCHVLYQNLFHTE
jgi:hypothetical protein